MDPQMIQMILQKLRGQPPQDLATAGQPSAPTAVNPGLAQAYAQPPGAAVQSATPSPFQLNPQMESQAGNPQANPILQQLMKHLGMLAMIRNRSNQQMIDPAAGVQ